MARSEIPLEDWLTNDQEMLTWLEQHLRRKGASIQVSNPYNPHPELLEAAHYLITNSSSQKELMNLKAAWRRYKSDKKHGNQVVQVRLSPRVKRQLANLSKRTSVSETVERLIKEEVGYFKDRNAAIQNAIQENIQRHEESAAGKLDHLQKERSKLIFHNEELRAELSETQKEMSNILFRLVELEVGLNIQAEESLELTPDEKLEALHRHQSLLDYFRNRIKAAASLAQAENHSSTNQGRRPKKA